jgi:hypothetical protein
VSTQNDIVRALKIIAAQLENISEHVSGIQRTQDDDIVPVLAATSDRVGEMQGRLLGVADAMGERLKNVEQRLRSLEASSLR